MTRQSAYWYWLASSHIGYKTAQKLIEYAGTADELFAHPSLAARAGARLSESAASKLRERANGDLLNAEILALSKRGIHIVTLCDSIYPRELSLIDSPPLALYVKGDIARLSDRRFAIVGTRKATRAGVFNTRTVARELSQCGVSIVSGMARGIDTAAGTGALEGGTPSAAILGCGVDVIYPPENGALYGELIETGAVISEFPPGTAPLPGNFASRNRIISGMCTGVLIAQGAVKSGAAITMRHALDENKDVFAMPGNINDPTSELPNLLISEGAIPITGASSISSYYGWDAPAKMNNPKKNPPELDFFEEQMYTLLLQGELGTDQLAAETGLDVSKVGLTLTGMELKGVIERLPGGLFGVKP